MSNHLTFSRASLPRAGHFSPISASDARRSITFIDYFLSILPISTLVKKAIAWYCLLIVEKNITKKILSVRGLIDNIDQPLASLELHFTQKALRFKLWE